MNFAQIKSFHLVATLGTFAQAAERLNATQPAVSARIAALERSLGVTLFDRSGHRVALTQEGRSFLEVAEQLMRIEAQYLSSARAGRFTGTLRIGVSDSMAISWFPDFLVELRNINPDMVVELRIGSSYRLREDLITRQIDIAILVGPLSDPEARNIVLCDCPFGFFAAPQLQMHARPLNLSDLIGHDIYTFERLTKTFQDISNQISATGVPLRLSPIGSLHTNILLVKKGLGIGTFPPCVIMDEIANGSLIELDVDFRFPEVRFVAAHLRGPGSVVAEAFAHTVGQFIEKYGSRYLIKNLYQEPKI